MFFSDYFEVDSSVLQKYGALDISLQNDLPLFIDPFLLYASDKEEYQALHNSILTYLAFLKEYATEASNNRGLLKEWFVFSEVKQNWLGYSQSGNAGRGLNMSFANTICNVIQRLYNDIGRERQTHSSHLEELALFGRGVGRDSISDFTTNLIKQYLLRYTQTFAKENINPEYLRRKSIKKSYFNYKTHRWEEEIFLLPCYRGDYVLLTPKDLLTKDETWMNNQDMLDRFDDIRSCVPNDQQMELINHRYMELIDGLRISDKKEIYKARKKVYDEFPILVKQYIFQREQQKEDAIKKATENVSEIENLYVLQLKEWLRETTKLEKLHTMPLNTYQEARERLHYFKHVIEDNDGYKLCYKNGEQIHKEKEIQLLFRFVWYDARFSVDREVNNGRGPVDYKVSMGSDDQTLVEFKLATNGKLEQNLKNQVEVYKKANQTESALTAIVYFDDKEYKSVMRILKELDLEGNENIVLIDASKKESTSNVK